MPSGVSGDPKELRKAESNWVTVLKDYQLMRNAHFETDAQNWHIIGTELVRIISLMVVIIVQQQV